MTILLYKSDVRARGHGLACFWYITRTGKYTGYHANEETVEAVGHGNMPLWAGSDAQLFWDAADKFERENGNAAHTRIIALPRELSPDHRWALAERLVAQHTSEKKPYSYAIHASISSDGRVQPHLHLMWSMRENDGIERAQKQFFSRYNPKQPERGGARKKTETSIPQNIRAEQMFAMRSNVADTINFALQNAGVSAKVDPRSNLARGLPAPTRSLTQQDWKNTELRKATIEMRQSGLELAAAEAELQAVIREFALRRTSALAAKAGGQMGIKIDSADAYSDASAPPLLNTEKPDHLAALEPPEHARGAMQSARAMPSRQREQDAEAKRELAAQSVAAELAVNRLRIALRARGRMVMAKEQTGFSPAEARSRGRATAGKVYETSIARPLPSFIPKRNPDRIIAARLARIVHGKSARERRQPTFKLPIAVPGLLRFAQLAAREVVKRLTVLLKRRGIPVPLSAAAIAAREAFRRAKNAASAMHAEESRNAVLQAGIAAARLMMSAARAPTPKIANALQAGAMLIEQGTRPESRATKSVPQAVPVTGTPRARNNDENHVLRLIEQFKNSADSIRLILPVDPKTEEQIRRNDFGKVISKWAKRVDKEHGELIGDASFGPWFGNRSSEKMSYVPTDRLREALTPENACLFAFALIGMHAMEIQAKAKVLEEQKRRKEAQSKGMER